MRAIAAGTIVMAMVLAAYATYRHFSDRGQLTTEAVYIGLERTVAGNRLVSPRDPAATLQVSKPYHYLGGQRFVLYGVANAEQHFFAALDTGDRLTSLYWIQFEEYLPDNSYRYDYESSPLRMNIDGYDFYVDTAPVKSDPVDLRAGSDGARAREFLHGRGYRMPDNYAYARLVHLTDESRRKELMIIYVDGPALDGKDPDDLAPGQRHGAAWPAIEATHLARIRRTLALQADRSAR